MSDVDQVGHIRIPDWFTDEYLSLFSGSEYSVYTVLVRHADRETGECHPSQGLIGQKCGISDRAVRDVLKKLVKKGIVKSTNQGMKSSIYTVVLPAQFNRKFSSGCGSINRKDSSALTGSFVPNKRKNSSSLTGSKLPTEPYSRTKLKNKTHRTKQKSDENNKTDDVLKVFEHYRTHRPKRLKKPNSQMKEWKRILARFQECYTVDDLKQAIDGNMRSAWHQGKNDENRKHDSLELITRSASKVDQFIEIPKEGTSNVNTKSNGQTYDPSTAGQRSRL